MNLKLRRVIVIDHSRDRFWHPQANLNAAGAVYAEHQTHSLRTLIDGIVQRRYTNSQPSCAGREFQRPESGPVVHPGFGGFVAGRVVDLHRLVARLIHGYSKHQPGSLNHRHRCCK